MKQCKFRNLMDNLIYGGIIDNYGNVICGWNGGLIEADKVCQIGEGVTENHTIKLIEIYANWMDLDEVLCGDLYDELEEEEGEYEDEDEDPSGEF